MAAPSTFTAHQAQAVSQKITLVTLEAAKRLMGWVLHSGSIYKLENFDHAVIASLEDSGTAYTVATSIAGCTAGKYYFDRQARILYLRASNSANPNSRFLAASVRYFFSDVAFNGPYDLATGFEVGWLPLLKKTSEFGVELSNDPQMGLAIEGSGSLEFMQDGDFWKPIFGKLTWQNQRATVYAYAPGLPITEAKKIYRGRVTGQSWSSDQVSFKLKDSLAELKNPVPLLDLSTLGGARIPTALMTAKRRRIYGYVNGLRPTNIDQVLDGYPRTGTIALTNGSTAITGTGTAFLTELSPEDVVLFSGDVADYAIEDLTSNTAGTLGSVYTGATRSGVTFTVKPRRPSRYMNRDHVVAGHALREPSTTVVAVLGLSLLEVGSIDGMLPDDTLTVAGEVTEIERILGTNRIKLKTNLVAPPALGAAVIRPSIIGVKLEQRSLVVNRDYTYNAATGTFTLDDLAEFNIAPIEGMSGSAAFTSGSRNVTGTGTSFKADFKPGDWLRRRGQTTWSEVLAIDSDTALRLRANCSYTSTGVCDAKRPAVYDGGNAVLLACDVMGATANGTTSGALLTTGPAIVADVLSQIGLVADLDAASFTAAAQLCGHRLGFAIPKGYKDTKVSTAREVINLVNSSIFGALVQDANYNLSYSVLRPARPDTILLLQEFDILKMAIESKSDKIAKTIRLNYGYREIDPVSRTPIVETAIATSSPATYLVKTSREEIIETVLLDDRDAQIFAARWAFLREVVTQAIRFDTKLQAALLSVTNPVEIQHRDLYERVGANFSRKIGAVQKATRTASSSSIELEDLANAFSRCGCITTGAALAYSQASETEKSRNGYVTDTYGMILNDPETHGCNLIF